MGCLSAKILILPWLGVYIIKDWLFIHHSIDVNVCCLWNSIECGGAEVIKIHARRVPVLLGKAGLGWVASNFQVPSDIATRQREDF